MKKYLLLCVAIFSLASCSNEKDLFEPREDVEGVKKDFSLISKVNISSNLPEGTRCLIYTTDPTGEGNSSNPIMIAYAPFSFDVPVAKAVDKLYAHVNGTVTAFDRGNIVLKGIETTGVTTRAAEGEVTEEPGSSTKIAISNEFYKAINDYYPEGVVNVWGDESRKSSDLYMADAWDETIVNEDGSTTVIEHKGTNVWITYITNGGSGFSGDLWYYTYTVDANGKPEQTLAQIEAQIADNENSQIFNRVEPTGDTGLRVYLGYFEPGTRIGFKFYGNANHNNRPYPKYSTPTYNKLAYEGRYSNGSWTQEYNGKEITGYRYNYRDNEYTCGVIRTWEFEGKEYATLGMENRLPSEGSWDGDYNDMICLLEADPLCVENKITPPVPDNETIVQEGYWLFEDNYPEKGDYDFNDLVVKYKITETRNGEVWQPTVIKISIMAKGADRKNSFGINDSFKYTNLDGYMNVYADQEAVATTTETYTVAKADKYIPVLNNGLFSFTTETYWKEAEDFPCVLDIPIHGNSKFLWCIERTPINQAYLGYDKWVDSNCSDQFAGWYLETPVAGTVWNK